MSDTEHLGDMGYHENLGLFSSAEPGKQYLGKFRGSVVNNVDPLGQGRLIVRVPDVSGFFVTSWALPCVPMAGPSMGTYFVPPPIGAAVWVEFEQGNPDKPIWVGCFWDGPAILPGKLGTFSRTAPGTPVIALETLTSGMCVSDAPLGVGTVNLYSGVAAVVSIGPSSIMLSAPVVSIVTQNFSVNGVQFTVV